MKSNEQRVIEKIRLLFFIVNELICAIIKQINKSELYNKNTCQRTFTPLFIHCKRLIALL